MAVRRKVTLRRIDPWTVLKFGSVLNLCLLAIGLIGFGVLWFAIRQLGVIESACELATQVGFEQCGVNGGNLFRFLLLLGALWVVVQTGIYVFLAFLHNIIADLVGGFGLTLVEEGAPGSVTVTSRRVPATEDRPREPADTAARAAPTERTPDAGSARTDEPETERRPAAVPTTRAPDGWRSPPQEPTTSRPADPDAAGAPWPWERRDTPAAAWRPAGPPAGDEARRQGEPPAEEPRPAPAQSPAGDDRPTGEQQRGGEERGSDERRGDERWRSDESLFGGRGGS